MQRDELVEELLGELKSERIIDSHLDLSRLAKKILRNPSSVTWNKYGCDFVAYFRSREDRLVCIIYGPQDPQLDITVCFKNERIIKLRGDNIAELYKKVFSNYQERASSGSRS